MVSTSDDFDPVSGYFRCWENHSIAGLDSIFDEDSDYIIDGKTRYIGLAEIKSYWSRNQERQSKLHVQYFVAEREKLRQRAVFMAAFTDRKTGCNEHVAGEILFKFRQSTGKIFILEEKYLKSEKPTYRSLLAGYLHLRWVSFSKKAKWTIKFVARSTVSTLLWALIASFILLGAVWVLAKTGQLPIWSTQWLVGSGTAGNSAIADLIEVLATIVGAFLIPLLSFTLLRRKHSGTKDIVVKKIEYRGQDLELMATHFRGAEAVRIFSGDFSFLEEHRLLWQTVKELCGHGKVVLVSYKSRELVERALGRSDHGVIVFRTLQQSGAFSFNSGVEMKCSIIQYPGGDARMLYLTGEGNVEDGNIRMCVLSENYDTRRILDAFRALTAAVIDRERRVWMKANVPRYQRLAIVLVGRSAAGKTTVAEILSDEGFQKVSASRVLRKFASGSAEGLSRAGLVALGADLLRKKGGAWFAEELGKAANGAPWVVIDGVRSVEAVVRLRELFSTCAVIYVAASTAARRERYVARESAADINFDDLESDALEIAAEASRPLADLVLENDKSKEELRKATLMLAALRYAGGAA